MMKTEAMLKTIDLLEDGMLKAKDVFFLELGDLNDIISLTAVEQRYSFLNAGVQMKVLCMRDINKTMGELKARLEALRNLYTEEVQ